MHCHGKSFYHSAQTQFSRYAPPREIGSSFRAKRNCFKGPILSEVHNKPLVLVAYTRYSENDGIVPSLPQHQAGTGATVGGRF